MPNDFVPASLAPYVRGTHLYGDKLTVIVPELPRLNRQIMGGCDMCEHNKMRVTGDGCTAGCPGEREICLDPKDAEAYLVAQVTRRIVGDV